MSEKSKFPIENRYATIEHFCGIAAAHEEEQVARQNWNMQYTAQVFHKREGIPNRAKMLIPVFCDLQLYKKVSAISKHKLTVFGMLSLSSLLRNKKGVHKSMKLDLKLHS